MTQRTDSWRSGRGAHARIEIRCRADRAIAKLSMPSRCLTSLSIFALLSANACKAVISAAGEAKIDKAVAGVTAPQTPAFPFAHGVRLYVSAVNCEMSAEDAARVNALSYLSGISVEVVFAGISGNDTNVVSKVRADLGLTVPVRLIRSHELEQYKSIGGAQMPMALLVKGRQLKTIVAGESMPRTLSLVEASLTSTAPPNHHNTPEE